MKHATQVSYDVCKNIGCTMRGCTALVVTPCLTHAFFLQPAVLPLSKARPSSLLSMKSGKEHESVVDDGPVSRAGSFRQAAILYAGFASVATAGAAEASAKTPVMKLPEDDSSKVAQRQGNGGKIPPFTVLSSGVQVTDIAVGDGAVAEAGKGVVLKWVMRRSNGYYVSSSAEGDGEPFVYRVGDEKRAIRGLDEGIRGMRAGGTRRIVVPPQLAYVEGCNDGKPGPIPPGLGPKQQINTRKGEPLSFEVKLTKVR